jgi:hypothetical protein
MTQVVAPTVEQTPELIDFVDFKWLMAAQGHRVHLERLQSDGDYAQGCIELASASGSDWLRRAASRLLGRMHER